MLYALPNECLGGKNSLCIGTAFKLAFYGGAGLMGKGILSHSLYGSFLFFETGYMFSGVQGVTLILCLSNAHRQGILVFYK